MVAQPERIDGSLRAYYSVICPKVGLKDFFFIGKGVGKDYMKYSGKIAKKHVDFLLCDPGTMKPICGIELDDISHTSKKKVMSGICLLKRYIKMQKTDQHIAIAIYCSIRTFGRACSFVYYMKYLLI